MSANPVTFPPSRAGDCVLPCDSGLASAPPSSLGPRRKGRCVASDGWLGKAPRLPPGSLGHCVAARGCHVRRRPPQGHRAGRKPRPLRAPTGRGRGPSPQPAGTAGPASEDAFQRFHCTPAQPPPTAESPSCGLGHIVPVLLTHIIHEPNCVAVPSPFGDNLSHLSSHWDRLESHVNGSVLPAASLGPSDITPCPAVAPQGEAGTAGAGQAAVAWQVTDTAQGAGRPRQS